jgi:cyanophycinase
VSKIFRNIITGAALFLSHLATAHADEQHLVLFGGGPRPVEALTRFVNFAGGANAQILVVTWASEIPEDVYAAIDNDLKAVGALNIVSALKAPTNADEKKYFLTQLSQSQAIFFSGGDQNRTMSVLKDNDLRKALVEKYTQGFVFAGTSAGTAMMSHHMMTGDSTPLGVGLGLLPHVIVDTHFLKRHRNQRLAQAISKFPDLLGVGIDEGAALVIVDGMHAQVVGPEQVVMIKAQASSTCEKYLKSPECFNLRLQLSEQCSSH